MKTKLSAKFIRVLLPILLLASATFAGGGPESLALVVNGDSWSSLSLANEYIRLHNIPSQNVITLQGIPGYGSIPVDDFREKILVPIFSQLEGRKLMGIIDCIVYSSDFPYRVDVRGDIGKRKLPDVIGKHPYASITGLTFLYQSVMLKNIDYLEMNSNWYALRPVELNMDPPWFKTDRDKNNEVMSFFHQKRMRQEMRKKNKEEWSAEDKQWAAENWKKSLAALQDLETRHPNNLIVLYNIACGLALTGKPEEAMQYLNKVVDKGWAQSKAVQGTNTGWLMVTEIAKDEDFTSLRQRPDFKKLLKRVADEPVYTEPGRAFSGQVGWTLSGKACPPFKGPRYMLSTMLGYTSGRGNSFFECLDYLRRAKKAHARPPEGTIYFMQNSDVRSTTRNWAIPGAIKRIQAAGVKAEKLAGKLPKEKTDIAGLFTGTASFNWEKSGCKMLPGAIAEHLTSCGGVMEWKGSQTPLSEFLRNGAAGASGSVVEPFAIQAKFPNAFLQAYYAEGFSLAESFYQAVNGPYQLLIVGDPLCAPWSKPPEVMVEGLHPDAVVNQPIQIKFSVTDDGLPCQNMSLFLDGRRLAVAAPQGNINLPIDKLPTGYHEIRFVATRADVTKTTGRVVIPFYKGEKKETADFLVPPEGKIYWGKNFTLKTSLPEAKEIVFLAHGRKLGDIQGGKQAKVIDTTALGIGTVRIQAIANLNDGTIITASPLKLDILPPPPLSLEKKPSLDELQDGMQFMIKIDGQKKRLTAENTDGKWLEKLGVKAGANFAMGAYFEVPKNDVYQFQFRGNLVSGCRLKIDDVQLSIPQGTSWRMLPVSLRQGWHRMTIQSKGIDSPRLDIRFGAKGTKPLLKERFRQRVSKK